MLRQILVVLLLLTLVAAPVQAATTYTYANPHTTTALTLTNLTNNSFSTPSAVVPNKTGVAGGGGSFLCVVEAALTFAANPTTGSGIYVYLIETLDDTNYSDAADVTGLLPNVFLGVSKNQTTTRTMKTIACPPSGNFKVQVQNAGTGQTITTGTIRVGFKTPQGN